MNIEGNMCDTLAAPIGCNSIIPPLIALGALILIIYFTTEAKGD